MTQRLATRSRPGACLRPRGAAALFEAIPSQCAMLRPGRAESGVRCTVTVPAEVTFQPE